MGPDLARPTAPAAHGTGSRARMRMRATIMMGALALGGCTPDQDVAQCEIEAIRLDPNNPPWVYDDPCLSPGRCRPTASGTSSAKCTRAAGGLNSAGRFTTSITEPAAESFVPRQIVRRPASVIRTRATSLGAPRGFSWNIRQGQP